MGPVATAPPWWSNARRAALSLGASTRATRGAVQSVYVVLLHDRSFPERHGLYVGQTSRDPDWRFDQHKAGYKASGAVRRFGERLLPELFQHLNPLQRWEALEIEAALAEAFRHAGVGWVEGGH
ncbi:hypothetical protein SAMN06297144_1211 [Sphingomonas guangdongensis]|uniref:GIY-YIG domain-containing protein n=1 Tax=Sphingomonas guangdongensis TaxID=1141890 RepID=A0A285QFX5_9SPHN|nr:hypothetical protein [Sphingomonas guangdongensis]SOB80736.1 hypothetical protein SAMN06297144_1211 [Sphingomonas guangdongensis]